MSDSPSILIVDDHQSIRDPLSTYLSKFGFAVDVAENGREMRERLKTRTFSLIVLDVMLPGENGLSLCRYVSEQLAIPVILLTAVGDLADRVAGLEIGADDYVVKPFNPRELVARIRSILRRSRLPASSAGHEPSEETPSAVAFSGWSLNLATRRLCDPNNQEVNISTAEFHLLQAFVDNANRVLSREQLLNLTRKNDSFTFDRSIDSQVSRLRKKLEADPRHPRLIKTIRGDGYMLASVTTRSRG